MKKKTTDYFKKLFDFVYYLELDKCEKLVHFYVKCIIQFQGLMKKKTTDYFKKLFDFVYYLEVDKCEKLAILTKNV